MALVTMLAQLKESRNFTIRERGRRPWLPQQQKFQPTIIPVPPATPRVRVVKGGRYGLSKARQFARTAGTVLVIAIFFGLFASIVASQARITQLSGEIDDAKYGTDQCPEL